jgi:FlaA1/EpsC-like NDP-sugar epimerase
MLLRAMRSIRAGGKRGYRVVGFLDDDPQRQGTRIAGVPVVGRPEHACGLAKRFGVQEILVVGEGLSGTAVRQLVDDAQQRRLDVRVLPSYGQLISGRVSMQPRPVAIEDLLRREPVALDLESIRRWIDGRTILVTGSSGSIGSEICRQLMQFSPDRIVAVDRWETGQFFLERELLAHGASTHVEVCLADVLDRRRMREIFDLWRPDVVFHAAAYKHVPLMESHPGEAVKNIVLATRQMADLAEECGAESFVLISTDKAVNPTSVMGTCKRVAELYVQSRAAQAQAAQSRCRFVTVRFGNVLDSAGSVVPVFRQQIAAGGPVTVTHPEMRRFFMTIPEAARLVVQAGAIGRGGEILMLDMGEPVLIAELASDMIRLSGLRVGEDVGIEFTGLRPGEKLYEELRLDEEEPVPTSHPKIITVARTPPDAGKTADAIALLERLAEQAPGMIRGQLERIVPEYAPSAPPATAIRRAA